MPTVTTFSYTGAVQTWTVPTGVTSIQVQLRGAKGGGANGGVGGAVSATLAVTPGALLRVYVGGYSADDSGGWNGGGSGSNLASGGGATDIRVGGTGLSTRVLVAGGGGGQGTQGNGGKGGNATGGNGTGPSDTFGYGGTQTAGGSRSAVALGNDGAFGAGGDGHTPQIGSIFGGAGGGGWYGGGGGAGGIGRGGGGGGGSSYIGGTGVSGATYTATIAAPSNHHGIAQITYNRLPNAPTLVAPAAGATISRTQSTTFSWEFNDPDTGDNQTSYELRYREVGTTAYTTLSGTTAVTRSVAANTFTHSVTYEWSVRTNDGAGWGPWANNRSFTALTPNSAPNAPTLNVPAANAVLNPTISNNFSWTFNDPNAGDNQSQYELRYRVVGTTAYTTLTGTTATTRAIASGTFTSGLTYEWSVRTSDGDLWGAWATNRQFSSVVPNSPPGAPTLNAPAAGGTIDPTIQQRFSWAFNDPDAGDAQSGFILEYNMTSGANQAVQTISNLNTPNQWVDIPAGTFVNGATYQWRVATRDQGNVQGQFSGYRIFNSAVAPNVPSITSPTNGATIPTQSFNVVWSAPTQQAYELRRTSTDGATVYWTSGVVSQTGTRQRTVDFPVNGRNELVQLRIQDNGLWSNWATRTVTVSYTKPADPQLNIVLEESNARLRLHLVNPSPTGSQPGVVNNLLYRRTADSFEDWNLIATLPANSIYYDYEVASNTVYQYRVVTRGTNSAVSERNFASPILKITEWWLKDLEDPYNCMIIFVEGDQSLRIRRSADQATFNPLGRKYPMVVKDTRKSASFNVTIQFLTNASYFLMMELIERQRTLLLQAPMTNVQWYIDFGAEVDEEIVDTTDPYRKITFEVIEVQRPNYLIPTNHPASIPVVNYLPDRSSPDDNPPPGSTNNNFLPATLPFNL